MAKPVPAKSASLQMSLTGLLALVACIALNIWLFRVGTLLGIIGMYLTKHVLIAYLCQLIGVNKQRTRSVSVVPPPAGMSAQ